MKASAISIFGSSVGEVIVVSMPKATKPKIAMAPTITAMR
jgi:hypothetical protein